MTDRELLELAAKAAGIRLEWDGDPRQWQPMHYEGKTYHFWNPLTDDGDALRLAVKLGLLVSVQNEHKRVMVIPDDPGQPVDEPFSTDPCSATRRTIVRAAAMLAQAE